MTSEDQHPEPDRLERPPASKYEILDAFGHPLDERPQQHWRSSVASFTIIAICVLVFFFVNLSAPKSLVYLTFSPAHGLIFPGLISHMFAHGDLAHLLVNMFVLYFIGTIVEVRYGTSRYLMLYAGSGLLAALAQAAAAPAGYLLGASGALAGVMAAFVRHYPHARLYIWGILPMPAWVAAVLWLGYNLFGAQNQAGGVAFVAHLTGFAGGLVLSLLLISPRGAFKS